MRNIIIQLLTKTSGQIYTAATYYFTLTAHIEYDLFKSNKNDL